MKLKPDMKKLFFAAGLLFAGWYVSAQNDDPFQRFPDGVKETEYHYRHATGGTVDQARVEPPFWWSGMANPKLELVIYDQNIKGSEVKINYPGVELATVASVQNPNYLFIEVNIGPGTQAGEFQIQLSKNGQSKSYPYQLRKRSNDTRRIQGLHPGDLMYLIMPDRFANGETQNDTYADMNQTGTNRQKIYFRHGGDLKGIINKLDYLQDLGITTLWLNPVQENNEYYDSYHGYAVTDHYNIDKRFGDNEAYLELVEACHAKGMKVVMDIIHNHVGIEHWFIKDLPTEDWIHQAAEFTRSNYRAPVWIDPYASEVDKAGMANGWFDTHMPDLNQQNKHLANYLIQNNIWWVEYAGIDGYRIDTYPYPDQEFMSEWSRRMLEEYPQLCIFGEVWEHGVGVQAPFVGNFPMRNGFNTHLPGVTDFQIQYAIQEVLTRNQGWTEGVSRLYYTLAQDYLYEDPTKNVLFLDNHDMSRYFSSLNENVDKFKSGIAMLLTMRGIPCLYYGTEILMTGSGGMFGEAGRRDFPGGWQGDPQNKFVAAGRTAAEQDAFQYIQRLAQFRKSSSAIKDGNLMQFIPFDGMYVFFRYTPEQTVMIVTNSTDQPVALPTQRFKERMSGFTKAKEIGFNLEINDLDRLNVPPHTTWVLELKH